MLIDMRRFGPASPPAAQAELLTDVVVPGEGRGGRGGEGSVSRRRFILGLLLLLIIIIILMTIVIYINNKKNHSSY